MKLFQVIIITLSFISCSQESENIIQENEDLLQSGEYYINQTWDQQSSGFERSFIVNVPDIAQESYGVVIALHGGGGNASNTINQYGFFTDKIVVAPQGYLNGWNVGNEPSTAPDVEFIKEIINYLNTFSNINSNDITIIGSSNGSALLNRLIIELDSTYFQNAISIVSQLNNLQYHNNSFWYNSSGNNNYDEQITPSTGKRIMAVNATNDQACPYNGGSGVASYVFLDSQQSIHILAQAMGSEEEILNDQDGVEIFQNVFKYTYLNGDVIHYKFQGVGHNLGDLNTSLPNLIISFLYN